LVKEAYINELIISYAEIIKVMAIDLNLYKESWSLLMEIILLK